tara:strand:+ start:7976 stop:8389 length:414 start_codon:yes stop_codon:yes gene_type:complete
MKGFSSITICGRLGADPQRKEPQENNRGQYTKARIVVNRAIPTADGFREEATWFSVIAFGYTAEALAKAKKGELVLVSGEFYSSEWQTREGEKRTTLEIKANKVGVIRNKPEDARQGESRQEQRQEYRAPISDDIPF